MFDGNTFLPVTGTPIRKIACMIRPLAEADPVPLAVAILNAKSFTLIGVLSRVNSQLPTSNSQTAQNRPALSASGVGRWELGVVVHTATSGITLPFPAYGSFSTNFRMSHA